MWAASWLLLLSNTVIGCGLLTCSFVISASWNPFEIATYATSPGWLDWYDTSESQAALGYQRTLFPQFLELLRKATEAALA
ncbi:MAG: hypothetical protein SXV54_12525 [Chloroflexota bacterium]|nr:hypothetical protein [Chloroflexota bacterium]